MIIFCVGKLTINFSLVSIFHFQKSKRSVGFSTAVGPPPERRSTISSMQGGYHGFCNASAHNNSNCSRMRNLSGGSVGSTTSGSSSGSCSNLVDNHFSSNNYSHVTFEVAPFTTNSPNNVSVNNNNSSFTSTRVFSSPSSSSSNSSHRNSRQERSGSFFSDNTGSSNGHSCERHGSTSSSASSQQQSQRSVNSSRYKTELCRPYEESGSCKYGDKCQFAHGMHELRNLSRHPKYKTELCRTFHTIGYCPYGPRCHFIHEEEPGSGKSLPSPEALPSPKIAGCGSVQSSSGSSSPSLSPSGCSESMNYSVFCYHPEQQQGQDNRQLNAHTNNGNYNSGSSSSDLDKQFSMMNLNTNDRSQEERDIFSHITIFREDELLDNASIPPAIGSSNTVPSPFQGGRQQLDNFPSFSESSSYWHPSLCGGNDFFSSILGSLSGQSDNHHHSLTSSSTDGSCSSGSDSGSSGGSDCGGSTENLNSSMFSEWRTSVAIGQY